MALFNRVLVNGVLKLNKLSRNFSQVNNPCLLNPIQQHGIVGAIKLDSNFKKNGVSALAGQHVIPPLAASLCLGTTPLVSGMIIPRPAVEIPANYRINPIMYDDKLKKPMEDPTTSKVIEDAPDISRVEKRAARLIVIRRIKMNKHKLRKLRKKMKHEWAKRKLRREIRKEREFLDSKLAQIREAERFDAKEYVANLIAKAKEKEIPRRWNGKRMPAWWIKEQIALGKFKL